MEKPKNKNTKAYENWEIWKLKNQCLRLWKLVVKKNAGGKCEACEDEERLNAHHIEDERLCPALRYDPRNGVGLCPTNHKFGKDSFHRSFIFAYNFMMKKRPLDLVYLKEHRNDKIKITKEYLLDQINSLENELKRV